MTLFESADPEDRNPKVKHAKGGNLKKRGTKLYHNTPKVRKGRAVHQSKTISVPGNVRVSVSKRVVRAFGPMGREKEDFSSFPIDIVLNKGKNRTITLTMWRAKRKQRNCLRTIESKILNMFQGVLDGYQNQMVAVYAHFPIIIKGKQLNHSEDSDRHTTTDADHLLIPDTPICLQNYLGERKQHIVHPMPDTFFRRCGNKKDRFFVYGTHKEKVGTTSSRINQAVRVVGKHPGGKAGKKDIRKFLDGIYVEKSSLADLDTQRQLRQYEQLRIEAYEGLPPSEPEDDEESSSSSIADLWA